MVSELPSTRNPQPGVHVWSFLAVRSSALQIMSCSVSEAGTSSCKGAGNPNPGHHCAKFSTARPRSIHDSILSKANETVRNPKGPSTQLSYTLKNSNLHNHYRKPKYLIIGSLGPLGEDLVGGSEVARNLSAKRQQGAFPEKDHAQPQRNESLRGCM